MSSDSASSVVETRYVEVPVVEWREVQVPRVQLVEIEKRVPKIEIVEIERVLEVPEYIEVTKEVDKVIEQHFTRTVPRHEVVEVPVEIEKVVPQLQVVQREEFIEVPGEIIEVPRHYTVEQKDYRPVYHDRKVPTVVTQVARPIIRPINHSPVQVHAVDYDPVLCKVIIPIPKPVPSVLYFGRKLMDEHQFINVPPREYNGLVKGLNRHLTDQGLAGLMYCDTLGRPIPPVREIWSVVEPKGAVTGRPQPPPPKELPKTHIAQAIAAVAKGSTSSEKGYYDNQTKSWLHYGGKQDVDDGTAARYYREHHQYFQRKRAQRRPQ